MNIKSIYLAIAVCCVLQTSYANVSYEALECIFSQRYFSHCVTSSGSTIQQAIGGDRHFKSFSLREKKKLSVDDKCFLAIYWGLSLPLDGESAELFGDFLGKDRMVVANRLDNISSDDLEKLCLFMGFKESRINFLRMKIKDWKDPKKQAFFN